MKLIFTRLQVSYIYQLIILILSLSLVLNFIPNVVFPGLPIYKYFGITILLAIYHVNRGLNNTINSFFLFSKTQPNFLLLFLPIFFLFLFEYVRFPINRGYSIFLFLLVPILINLFILFLVDIYFNYSKGSYEIFLNRYVKPYFILANIIVISAILLFILLKLGIVDLNSWKNVSIYGKDFQQRQISDIYPYYSNPLYITVIIPSYVKIGGFVGEFGSFSGWSYEPHIACYFLVPSFLMINYFEKRSVLKYLLVTSYLLFFILAFSITSIIGLLIILIIFLSSLNGRKLKLLLLLILPIICILLFLLFTNTSFNKSINYASNKIGSKNASSISTSVTINYLLSPKTFFGNGLFSAPEVKEDNIFSGKKNIAYSDNVGIVPFVLFVCIFCIAFLLSFSKIFGRSDYAFIGLIVIYLLFHAMKFPFHVFSYPFTYFFLFIVSIINTRVD